MMQKTAKRTPWLLLGILASLAWPLVWSLPTASCAERIPPIPRRIPPAGMEISAADRDKLAAELTKVRQRLQPLADHELAPDIEIYVKAVDLALRHGEFYRHDDIAKAHGLLVVANQRLDQLAAGKTPWTTQRGLVVRGYRSSIDGSAQPYGVEIPKDLASLEDAPFYVWLHGRGDKTTDLHFIHQRQAKAGKIAPRGAIVVHPFGRHCIGFKSAGEIDVLDALAHARRQYQPESKAGARTSNVLAGFSMGGAGAWHIGAHFPDRWAAVSAGAGFAETARYNRLAKDDFPVWYEQRLWGLYDVPGYTRNLLNMPVIAYSGEKDKQIQAARVMEEAFLAEGQELPHIIGPGMGHAYHPDSLKEIMRRLEAASRAPRKDRGLGPRKVFLQTRTLSYAKVHWLQVSGLEEHWRDARVDAEVKEVGRKTSVIITTSNVTRFSIPYESDKALASVQVDGTTLQIPDQPGSRLQKSGKIWSWTNAPLFDEKHPAKSPGRQGPIDDAFRSPFLVVVPTGNSKNANLKQWVDFELAHFQDRWRALYRGEVRLKKDVEVSDKDVQQYHLILWGDAESNQVIRRLVDRLPIKWNGKNLVVRGQRYSAADHVPLLIYPNPENISKYVVINSGPTHREGHDRTNSLQNPKLPDWAVIDMTQSPDADSPGRVVDADFFDEQWGFKKSSQQGR